MPPSLLVPSDDSDGGDCERRPARRRLFQKSEGGTRRFLADAGVCHCLLLTVLSFSLAFVAANTYSLTSRYAELQEITSALNALPSRMQTFETHLHRLRMEFDLWRESSPYHANQTKDTTEYVYDVLERMSTEVREMKKKVAMASSVTEDVSRRLSTVEARCLNVCRTASLPRDREQPRRRQAAKASVDADDEIVFRRN